MSLENFLNNLKIGKGNLTNVNDAKFLLDRSFTAKRLLEVYIVSDNVLQYVLARMTMEKTRLN